MNISLKVSQNIFFGKVNTKQINLLIIGQIQKQEKKSNSENWNFVQEEAP